MKTLAALLFVSILALGVGHAATVPTDWFSNQSSSNGVVDPIFAGQPAERLRLQQGFNEGFVEGQVDLGFDATWTISAQIRTDGNADLPDEFVRISINGVQVAEFFNSPVSTTYDFETDIMGDSFSYRFDFFSPSQQQTEHLIVGDGAATAAAIPVPAAALLFAPMALFAVRRRRA